MKERNMLEVKRTDTGGYYITLNGECIHGGFYTKEDVLNQLKAYQKIWDAGYHFKLSEENEE